MRLHIVTVSHDHRLSVVVPAAALGAAIAVDSLPIGVKQSINPKQHSEVTFIARKVVFFMPIDGCLWTVGVSGGQWESVGVSGVRRYHGFSPVWVCLFCPLLASAGQWESVGVSGVRRYHGIYITVLSSRAWL